MRRSVLLPFLVASTLHAGSLLFLPDTVRFGNSNSSSSRIPDSTKVRSISASASASTLRLKRLVAPFQHSVKSAVLFTAPDRREYAYRIDSVVATGSRFVHHLSRDTNYLPNSSWTRARFGNAKAPDLQLAPNETVILRNFRLGECEQFPVRALATTYPANLCREEPTDFLFETGVAGFDTLHVVSNHWSTGTRDRAWLATPSTETRYAPDGRLRIGPAGIRDIGTVVRTPERP